MDEIREFMESGLIAHRGNGNQRGPCTLIEIKRLIWTKHAKKRLRERYGLQPFYFLILGKPGVRVHEKPKSWSSTGKTSFRCILEGHDPELQLIIELTDAAEWVVITARPHKMDEFAKDLF